jgi:hypothetical protein
VGLWVEVAGVSLDRGAAGLALGRGLFGMGGGSVAMGGSCFRRWGGSSPAPGRADPCSAREPRKGTLAPLDRFPADAVRRGLLSNPTTHLGVASGRLSRARALPLPFPVRFSSRLPRFRHPRAPLRGRAARAPPSGWTGERRVGKSAQPRAAFPRARALPLPSPVRFSSRLPPFRHPRAPRRGRAARAPPSGWTGQRRVGKSAQREVPASPGLFFLPPAGGIRFGASNCSPQLPDVS